MQLFGFAGIWNLFCVIISDGVKSVVGWVSMFGGLLVFLSGVYALGLLVVFLSVTAAVFALVCLEISLIVALFS